jgi:hypothetical protein
MRYSNIIFSLPASVTLLLAVSQPLTSAAFNHLQKAITSTKDAKNTFVGKIFTENK